MARIDGRRSNELRKLRIKKGYLKYADGSCLIECGNTKVICSATLEDKVPVFLRGQGRGWLTAEYCMLPSSCPKRITRDAAKGKISGRTHEIQRLIGRSLRAVVDFEALGERTVWIDCDVIQGDGGTRTAAISGSFVALAQLVERKMKEKLFTQQIITNFVGAVSVGIVNKKALLDLCYQEDSTAEGEPFSGDAFQKLLSLAQKGIREIIQAQRRIVKL